VTWLWCNYEISEADEARVHPSQCLLLLCPHLLCIYTTYSHLETNGDSSDILSCVFKSRNWMHVAWLTEHSGHTKRLVGMISKRASMNVILEMSPWAFCLRHSQFLCHYLLLLIWLFNDWLSTAFVRPAYTELNRAYEYQMWIWMERVVTNLKLFCRVAEENKISD
jgi:hypothetical protein